MSSDKLLDDKRLEILYQHYCAMVDRNKSDVRTRYRYLLYTLALLVFNLLQMLYSGDADVLVNGLLGSLANIDESKDFASIDFIATLALMLFVIRYLQIVISVERQYPHIHSLEQQLSAQFGGTVFSFEGIGYLKNYPKLLDVSHLIFTIVVPASFLAVALWRIGIQFPVNLTPDSVPRCTIIVFSTVTIVFVVLYWRFLCQSKKQDKSQQPNEPESTSETEKPLATS
ncbi:MAG: hypothetical protein OXG85_11615 [Chloroflexi bacterium]|nr:hypothetical protein [Chloroflexota bacterium]